MSSANNRQVGVEEPNATYQADHPIKGFFGPYRFLSNFWYVDVSLAGVVYPTTEHAYQACKTYDDKQRALIRKAKTPAEAKKLGREVTLRPHWDNFKVGVMRFLNIQKYERPDLRAKLLATGSSYLEETNTWNDKFWGVCDGEGKNVLGHTLMFIRQQIRFQEAIYGTQEGTR